MWCELATEFSRLEELSAAWKRWVQQDPAATFFQSWEWVRAFWKAHGAEYSLCSVIVHEGDRPVGVLPLMRKGRRIVFLATSDSDYNDFVCEEGFAIEVLESALDFMLRSELAWTCLELDKIPAHSKMFRNAKAVSPAIKRRLKLVYRCPSPAVVVDEGGSVLDDLMRKEQVVRNHKRLRKLGAVTLRHVDNREEAREHLGRFFRQHVARWAMVNGRSQFADAEARNFYEALINELDPVGQLRFSVLELNSDPVAYHFGFQHRGKLIWYKPTFDVNYWDYCPGDVLLSSLLQDVRQLGLNELDFTIGDEPYKYRFANHVRQNYILYVERQPVSVGCCLRSAVRFVQHRVRQRPELKAALKKKIGMLSEIGRLDRKRAIQSCRQRLRGMRGWVQSAEEASLWASTDTAQAEPSDMTIREGNLEDLALLSAEFDCFLTAGQLHQYRRFIKQGDKLFIARNSNGERFVILLGSRNEIEAFTAGADRTLRWSEPILVILECWKAPEVSTRYVPAEVLRALTAHLAGTEVWIYNLGDNESLKQAIEGSGMEIRHRMVRRTFLRSSRYTRLESIPDKDLSGKPVVKGVVGAKL
jgi:CelD/BcsL family acetyltransferase involved in cellulose biosynthesis